MPAIAFVAWRDLRRRWLGTVAAALLVGIVGAVVLSTVAGARRSDSALRRFNAYSRSADIELTVGQPSAAQMAAFARTRGIAALAVLRTYALEPTNIPVQQPAIGVPLNGTMDSAVDRPRLVSGRLENPAVAALLAFFALAAISHTLVTGTRRRRRELAILRTLGFKQRQVRSAIASQATTLVVVGLLLGIPIGLLAGSTIWRAVANSVSVINSPVVPVSLILALIMFTVVAVNFVAYLPARAASHIQPARALRSE